MHPDRHMTPEYQPPGGVEDDELKYPPILPIFFVIVGLAALACTSVTNSGNDSASSSVLVAPALNEPATIDQAASPETLAQTVGQTVQPSSGSGGSIIRKSE